MRTSRRTDATPRFVVCIDNSGYQASLELHKIYSVIPGQMAIQDGDLRIVDESGEEYLYSAARFVAIDGPKGLEPAMLEKASGARPLSPVNPAITGQVSVPVLPQLLDGERRLHIQLAQQFLHVLGQNIALQVDTRPGTVAAQTGVSERVWDDRHGKHIGFER